LQGTFTSLTSRTHKVLPTPLKVTCRRTAHHASNDSR
jgi:hypothetical protein